MSTNLISGLSSGFDWRTMVDQLIAIDRRRVTLIENNRSAYQEQLTEWQSFNTKLLSLKTAAEALRNPEDFIHFRSSMTSDSATVKASDLISVASSSSAAVGTYSLSVEATAAAQRLSSGSFSSSSEALGLSGDILVNGAVITLGESDSLAAVRTKINSAGAGVTASIAGYGDTDYRLTLTNSVTGSAGLSLANAGSIDILGDLGLVDAERIVKHDGAGGHRSDTFSSRTTALGELLNLTDAQAGTIYVNGTSVTIDLAADSLNDIAEAMNTAGIAVSVISESTGDDATYRLFISGGSNTYADSGFILEALGVLRGGFSDVMGVRGTILNTSGGTAVSADTLLKNIDGYSGYQAGDYIALAGMDTAGGAVSDTGFIIGDETALGDLLAHMETVYGNVTATITAGGALQVVDNGTEGSTLSVQVTVHKDGGDPETTLAFAGGGDLGEAAALRKREIVQGRDASMIIDGVTVTSATNVIDDIIEGVTVNLLKADSDTTVTISVERDTSSVMTKINSFVSSYNAVATYINEQRAYDAETGKTGGVLFGDGTLASIKSDMVSAVLSIVIGVNADFSLLNFVGITLDDKGLLVTDGTALANHLKNNFDDLVDLFSVQGITDGTTLEFVLGGSATRAGTYDVRIDQAATRGSVTGAIDLSGGLDDDVTLALTVSNYRAIIDLTAGTTIEDIVEAVNTELGTARSEVQVGAVKLYEGGGQSSAITADTAWDQVYVGGNSANLVDGDRIAFSGMNRSGQTISGNYEITDVSTETVQGLLTAVESAYGTGVSASIDDNGRIVITDSVEGPSRLSLSFNMKDAHQLSFGSIGVSDDGSDGSRMGRYALDITASDDGTGKLVITHNSYGSKAAFTLEQFGEGLLGLEEGVFQGLDVAGTINGEESTGSGQILTGGAGAAMTQGLSIRYTGEEPMELAGTVTFITGVAEQFSRTLSSITDPVDGYLAFKRESLVNSISSFDSQIERMTELLNRKSQQMINRFVAMELALNKIQSQSDWLTGQLNAAYMGWQF